MPTLTTTEMIWHVIFNILQEDVSNEREKLQNKSAHFSL